MVSVATFPSRVIDPVKTLKILNSLTGCLESLIKPAGFAGIPGFRVESLLSLKAKKDPFLKAWNPRDPFLPGGAARLTGLCHVVGLRPFVRLRFLARLDETFCPHLATSGRDKKFEQPFCPALLPARG